VRRPLGCALLVAAMILGDGDTRAAGAADAGPDASARADAGAPDSGALPPGHPPVEEKLPAGHPPVDASPHSAGPQRRGEDDPGFFNPPNDGVEEDPSLPPGVVLISVRDAEDKPMPRAPIQLTILRSSVTKGESRESRAAEADESGSFRFEGLSTGGGVTYRVSTERDRATFALPAFPLSDQAGKRAVLHAYEAASDINEVFVGMQVLIYVQLREENISVEHLFNVFNLGPVAWLADVTFALPEGYKAFNKPDNMDEMRFEEVNGSGAALRGTVAPGRHGANFRYQVPFKKDERQTIRVELPPRVAQVRVIAEASKTMGLSVEGFPPSQRTQSRDGKRILVTEQRAQRAGVGMNELVITLTGLPTPSPIRWYALGLAGIVAIGGLFFSVQRREDEALDDDSRRELLEARDALLDEFVELERLHKKGELGPKTYSRVRDALLDALARIVSMIEAAPQPRAPAERAAGPRTKSKGAPGKTTRKPRSGGLTSGTRARR
jgi:hypothetical protein